eukprot:INCI17221.2.p1 GENE.INCI17221.2~~INCI17221.2.p1  ORF type:complete len:458 (+),score=55.73 INCI17221.2:376-1749(+)
MDTAWVSMVQALLVLAGFVVADQILDSLWQGRRRSTFNFIKYVNVFASSVARPARKQAHDPDFNPWPVARGVLEGVRRQLRHLEIQREAEQAAMSHHTTTSTPFEGSSTDTENSGRAPHPTAVPECIWRVDMERRLLALSYLGVFEFRLLATESPDNVAFFDQHHPMVTRGHFSSHSSSRDNESQAPRHSGHRRHAFVVEQLRAMFPKLALIAEGVRLHPAPSLAHAVCAFACAVLDMPFYYYVRAQGLWLLVERQVKPQELSRLPVSSLGNLTTSSVDLGPFLRAVAPVPPNFPSYLSRVHWYEVERGTLMQLRGLADAIQNTVGQPVGTRVFSWRSGCSERHGCDGLLEFHCGSETAAQRRLTVSVHNVSAAKLSQIQRETQSVALRSDTLEGPDDGGPTYVQYKVWNSNDSNSRTQWALLLLFDECGKLRDVQICDRLAEGAGGAGKHSSRQTG